MKTSILASNEKELDSALFDEFFVHCLPFSAGSLKKLLFKVIAPSMMQKMKQETAKNLQNFIEKLRLKAQDQQSNANSQQDPTKKKESSIALSEPERIALYTCIQDEFDAFSLEEALRKAQSTASETAEEPRDESAFRKEFFINLQGQLEGIVSSASITGSFAASKRRVLKNLTKQCEKSEVESEKKAA